MWDHPGPGVKPVSPALEGGLLTTEPPGKVKESEVTQSCPTLCNPMDRSIPGSSVDGIFQPRVAKEMGCHFLLQRIFLTQRSNPGLPYGRQTLYYLSHQVTTRHVLKILIIYLCTYDWLGASVHECKSSAF